METTKNALVSFTNGVFMGAGFGIGFLSILAVASAYAIKLSYPAVMNFLTSVG